MCLSKWLSEYVEYFRCSHILGIDNLNNPVVFNAVGRFARISDVAKVSGENLDELLKFINAKINDNE